MRDDHILRALRDHIDPDRLAACLARLRAALPDPARPSSATVLVAYGGGKDSAYTTAFVRALQLALRGEAGATFRLRLATNRHAGMPQAVQANIDRTYRALGIPDDPDCEALLIDGELVRPFDASLPQHPAVVRRNRTDILMNGHRTGADGRPTFCNACNLSVATSFGLAAAHGTGVDVIVTGDSPAEQRAYLAWIRGLGRRLGALPDGGGGGFGGVLDTVDGIGRTYFADLYGADDPEAHRGERPPPPAHLRFFSIYDHTAYAAGAHWELLTGFLGFAFDDLAFSFTESDCANPALMAHLRGLKHERVFGRDYAEGIGTYVDFATGLMRRKEIPEDLIRLVADRYRGPAGIARMRAAMDAYASGTFGLAERQLVCMAWAPFAAAGRDLDAYLAAERVPVDPGEARGVLTGGDDPVAAAVLEEYSGLPPRLLRVLYGSDRYEPAAARPDGIVATILEGDPHTAEITTRHTPDGPAVTETISGR